MSPRRCAVAIPLLRSQRAKTDSLRQRDLPVVVRNEAPRLECNRGGDVQYVERPSPERGRVQRAQFGGEIKRAAPEDVKDREPSFANVGIEIGNRRLREAIIDFFAMRREVDRVDDLSSPKSRDREAASEAPPPSTEASGTVVV